jgi:hypothetical protein
MMSPKPITFDEFRSEWLREILEQTDPKVIRRLFVEKIFSQWLDLGEPNDNWISSKEWEDLGIDLIYFEKGESVDKAIQGDTWYIVKGFYEGVLHPYTGSVLDDGQSILDLFEKKIDQYPKLVASVIDDIQTYILKSWETFCNDRIVLVLATEKPLTNKQIELLEELIRLGRTKLGSIFDVAAISVKTIYTNALEHDMASDEDRLKVSITATVSESDANLVVGTVKLPDLYWFLRNFQLKTGDLDQLYEKNVRRFLGSSGPINRAIQNTLLQTPAAFGLYNNGITIVVEKFDLHSDTLDLFEPYIVNGCQTTRTIWEVFRKQFEAGIRGMTPSLEEWRKKVSTGVVVVKIVKVGDDGETLLQNITRYTNSQNAVEEKDFLTLEDGFHQLKSIMADKYGIFLEVQRGGWESQSALQKMHPTAPQFDEHANAFELLKVYGAGWLREAGNAFSRNKQFLPGGTIYKKILQNRQPSFGVDDLYAAYILMRAGAQNGFGRGAQKLSRRSTRYFFYLVTIELLRDILLRTEMPSGSHDLSLALIKVFNRRDAWTVLISSAVNVVDEYLTRKEEEESVFKEPALIKMFNGNLGNFFQWEGVGDPDKSPQYAEIMRINKRLMGRGQPSPRDEILSALKA